MALPIELCVVDGLNLSVLASGDARLDALRQKGLAIPVTVVATISQYFLGRWQGIQLEGGSFVVAHLPLREQQHDSPALAVAQGV